MRKGQGGRWAPGPSQPGGGDWSALGPGAQWACTTCNHHPKPHPPTHNYLISFWSTHCLLCHQFRTLFNSVNIICFLVWYIRTYTIYIYIYIYVEREIRMRPAARTPPPPDYEVRPLLRLLLRRRMQYAVCDLEILLGRFLASSLRALCISCKFLASSL